MISQSESNANGGVHSGLHGVDPKDTDHDQSYQVPRGGIEDAVAWRPRQNEFTDTTIRQRALSSPTQPFRVEERIYAQPSWRSSPSGKR